jgi:uncharacterized membrane protein YsdA (DUF1294 family)
MGKRTRPEVYHGIGALLIVTAGVALLFLAFRLPFTWYHVLAAWLLAINLVTFGYYGYDKARARSRGSRIPEVVLHGLVLLGGTIGGYLGMHLFRHKTIKPAFRLMFWLIVFMQVALIAAVIYRLWRHHA